MTDIRAIVTDIEGTTSSISFVRDVLFPYARKRLPAFVETHGDRPRCSTGCMKPPRKPDWSKPAGRKSSSCCCSWIDEDRKSTALKALQGMIWKDGYEAGDYRAHMYPEVAARCALARQRAAALYVYSSGSVPAQQLFFRYSEAGDLTPLFAGYFDTETGPKREAESYRRIAEASASKPGTYPVPLRYRGRTRRCASRRLSIPVG
jgi:enolase-phosphatase E1